MTEYFALIKEPHCLGFRQDRRQTVAEWIQSQGLPPYIALNDRFLDMIALKHRAGPGPLDMRSNRIFELALYDIDRFREHIFRRGLVDVATLAADDAERLRNDDVELLRFAHEWVKEALFEKPTSVHI
jgi:hypothetical protein